jgi:hypothetical protein
MYGVLRKEHGRTAKTTIPGKEWLSCKWRELVYICVACDSQAEKKQE